MRMRRAFTLVEAILVIAIVSLLMSLLLPTVSKVRGVASSTECQTHLRQMVLAAQQYANLFEVWPAAIRYENPGEFTTIAWDWQQTASGHVEPGPLWMFTDNPDRVMQCPVYHGDASFGADPFTGYNYNTSYLGGEAPFPALGWDHVRRGVPPHACQRADRCAMFGDGGRAGPSGTAATNKFMRAPLNHEGLSLPEIYSGGQAFRHIDATNVAYVDGHVGSHAHLHAGSLATDDLLSQFMGYPRNGFLSDDDAAYNPR